GELAAARGDLAGAISYLKNAVRLQDDLTYMEPPPWYHSTRLALGVVLLEANRSAEAEAAFRQDLEEHPENGWALLGLRESLIRQGRTQEAEEAGRRFVAAWRHADIPLTS